MAEFGDIGHRDGQAEVLNYLGEVLARSGAATRHGITTLERPHQAREVEGGWRKPAPWAHVRPPLHSDGDPGATAALWKQALEIYERIGVPRTPCHQETLHQRHVGPSPRPPVTSAPGESW